MAEKDQARRASAKKERGQMAGGSKESRLTGTERRTQRETRRGARDTKGGKSINKPKHDCIHHVKRTEPGKGSALN